MKQVINNKGRIKVDDIPIPLAGKNEVLVQVHYSCISAGTEMDELIGGGMPLYKRAIKEPKNVKKVFDMLKTRGIKETLTTVQEEISCENPMGYSASGVVLESGEGINDLKPGDTVACAGAGIAGHAEFIAVPRNLIARVPEGLSLDVASTVTLGSIAIQAVRRADAKLGESVAVIGLGVLGQIVSQLLKAAGCKVIGVDVNGNRIDMALASGIGAALNATDENAAAETIRFSGGHGVDTVIITASTKESVVVNQAMEMARKKGRIVIVGDVGLDLERKEFYKKELDVLMSTSYGPGRYDKKYELNGEDYPYAYVRWTENRNMQEYIDLLSDGKVNVKPFIDKTCPVEKAPEVYDELVASKNKPLITLFEYKPDASPERKVVIAGSKRVKNKISLGIIGSGSFARGIHLPNLKKLSNLYDIQTIAGKRGLNAKQVARDYNAAYATTDVSEVLRDNDVDMVLISTRHDLHVEMAISAAQAGKAVFLEKPMALDQRELDKLVNILEEKQVPFMVGFNRRFSPYAVKIKEMVEKRVNPMIINYRMNAGFLPKEHWVHTGEGGGRNIGEACHIYDLFQFFTGTEVASINAAAIDPKTGQYARNDNFSATIKYKDGSVCNLIYTSLGTKQVAKEQMEIFWDGKIIRLDNYKRMEVAGVRGKGMKTLTSEKGHKEELAEFAGSIKDGTGYPIPLWQLIQATEVSFEVERQLM